MINVEIDKDSGFCFGVTTAIGKAEEELRKTGSLYCLGDIVHNGIECQRLHDMGLKTINHAEFASLTESKVLFRAHGEPPETYETAERNHIELIDATCPVVLQLQKKIHDRYLDTDISRQQIVIYGQKGHAEVLGLVGQTKGHAMVVESANDLDKIDFSKEIFLYAQTTKPQDGYQQIIDAIKSRLRDGSNLTYFNTICGQVSHRREHLRRFATAHDMVLFVAGQKSSNGKVLFTECAGVNPRTYSIEGPSDIDFSMFRNVKTVGICGATSTPKWLMEQCRQAIMKHFNLI